jgi:hypothetical protein
MPEFEDDIVSEEFAGDDPGSIIDVEAEPAEEAPPAAEPAAERLYAGKYKTPEDMERAYLESQSAMTKAQQEAAEFRRYAEQQQAQPPPQQPDYSDELERLNDEFLSNPYGFLTQSVPQMVQQQVQQVLAQRDTAQRNVKQVMNLKATDPHFDKVKDDFEAVIAELDPSYLQNPNSLADVAEYAYTQAVGRAALAGKLTAAPPPPPPVPTVERVSQLEQTGPGVAQPASTGSGLDTVDQRGMSALRAFGLGAEDQKDAISRAQRGGE